MTSHILTHNYYAITSLVTLTLGSFNICHQMHERWLSTFKMSLMDVNAVFKVLITALGFTIISWQSLLNTSYQLQSLAIFIGMIVGLSFVEIETYLLQLAPNVIFVKPQLNIAKTNSIKNILSRKKHIKIPIETISYSSTIIAGTCEEILYRGFMTVLCLALLNTALIIPCLLLVTFLFALSHISLGSIHVLSKFILGLICLFSFLYTKTILTPIFIHITFNSVAVNKFRKLANE